MGNSIKTYIISFGSVTNNGVKCTNPIVTPAGSSDIAINCIDPEGCLYKVQVGPNDDEPCLKFIVQCEECDDCGPVVIEKCFCDDQDDCKECEICGEDGFCEKLCDKCCDGECCDCETDADCPCNKECVNGACVCPPGTTENENGCCDECQNDGDCPVCHKCVFKNGYKQCVPLDCPCDPDGRCGKKGQCVECLNTGDCTDAPNECCINCECDCCPGYTRINGVCVECDCQSDDDCDICETCSRCGCRPQQCPPGEVPTVINGQCVCVEECDCEEGGCSSRFDYCDPTTVNPDVCGCIPCQGNCSSGCQDPCICDPTVNKCVFNPCQGSCTNGTDCPSRDCGCLNGECVPCFLLDCSQPSSDCEGALGCECTNSGRCGPAGCPPTPCSVAADCPFGCTCFEGICVSCDNFSCVTKDCTNQPGCACVNGKCEGDEEDCEDTLTMEKDDEDCTLTGTLVKKECCQCSPLTVDAQGQIAGENETHYTINFVAEVRKGAYTGGPVDNIPKLDNYTNINIANNEPPTAGSVFLLYEIFYDVYEIIDGEEVRTGEIEKEEQSTAPVVFPGYTITPDQPINPNATATLRINGISLPKINARFQSGNTVRYVRNVDLGFFLAADLQFHNKCRYKGNVQFADYNIQTDSNYKAFPVSTTTYGNARAETVKSSVCRDPFFKWYKSDTNSFSTPFRKLYVAPASTSFTWIDELSTREQGLESCKYYLLETDCTCQGPVSDYIVFCNPADINYELSQCNTVFELFGEFIPCDPNEDEVYYIEAGSIYREFGPDEYTGKGDGELIFRETSTEEITEVVFGIVCDTQGICTKTYPVEDISPLEVEPTVTCTGAGKIEVVFTAPASCGISKLEIYPQLINPTSTPIATYGTTIAGGTRTIQLDPGHYSALIHWSCGCDPDTVEFGDDCCEEIVLSDCLRDCITGEVEGCVMEEGITYYDANGNVLQTPNGLRDYIAAASLDESVDYTAQKGACDPLERSLAPVDGDCCDDFDLKFEPNKFDQTKGVAIGTGGFSPSLEVDNAFVKIGTRAELTPSVWTWELTDIPENTPTLITLTDPNCEDEPSLSYQPNQCLLDISSNLNPDDCGMVASVDAQTCECPEPIVKLTINAVSADSNTYTVTWSTEFMPVDDADPTAGSIEIKYPDPTTQATVTETFAGTDHTQRKTIMYKSNLGTLSAFQVTVKDVTTEDNCKFANASTTVNIGLGVAGEVKAMKLTHKAGTSLDRTVKFTWNRYNPGETAYDLTYIDYGTEDSGVELSIVATDLVVDGQPFLQQGRMYRVEGECKCKDAETFRYCCLPEVSTSIDGCNDTLNITLTGADGSYYVKYGGVEYPVDVVGGTGGTSISAPLHWEVGEYYPVGFSSCSSSFSFDLEEGCTVTFQTDACTGDMFSLNVYGCQDSDFVPIDGGYGSVINQGSYITITGINRNDAVVFKMVNSTTGCETETLQPCNPSGGITTNCYTPQCAADPSPSVTPTVTPSINSSPSPTPTRTPSRSPGASPDPTPSITPTTTTTPSITPTVTPSITVSRSPGSSPDPTPSVTPSTTITPTQTPSITPTQTVTKTPTVTPSITPTKTPSKTVTRTPSVTRSITPTRTVTPSSSVAFLFCNGVQYDPLTHKCCGTIGEE